MTSDTTATFDPIAMMPADTPAFMFPAWWSCILFAAGDDDLRKQFTDDTGVKFSPPKNGIEAMIDAACKTDEHFARRFIEWVNVNVWGPMDGDIESEVTT